MSGVRRVIVGASGSPGSLRALRHAEDLARHSSATLTPVLAWVPPGGELAARQPCPELVRIWHEAAWQRLWAALEVAWGPQLPDGLSVQPVVQRGQSGPILVAVACRPDDLLVVGAGRRGAVPRLSRGRVSRYCMAHAVCPVLAVPPAILAKEGRGLHGWVLRRRGLDVEEILRGGGSVTA
ncbi:MAG TPA: universal stress protein [Streptosporangiaceae bacterium]|nr:universal stress protein [Streptosporangiaceae bacterium]